MASNRFAALSLATVALLGLAACSSGSSDSADGGGDEVVIATTNFSETNILANMYQQALEANGVNASVKELTTREVIEPALSSGEVQLTPEYLGSLTEFLNKKVNGPDAPQIASGDVDATLAAARPLAEQENITLLTPSPAQDQNAFAVTADFAAEHDLQTLTQLGEYSQGSPITLGGPPECPERPFCQLGLEDTYGVKVASFLPLDAGGPLTIQAMNQGKIQVGLVFSSSGSVASNNLVVLQDDQGLQTAENITPAVYTPALTPEITSVLDEVSAALTTDELQRLNEMVDVDRQSPATVAKQFLESKGLL